jgi:membrane protein
MSRTPGFLEALLIEARALSPREAVREIRACFKKNDLLTYASAISFRVVFATIPGLLFTLGLLGTLGLSEVWSSDAAPQVREGVSAAMFTVIDDTVGRVLAGKQIFWVTVGAAIALYVLSSAVRTIIGVLDRIYDTHDERPWVERLFLSLWLAALVGAMVIAAVASVTLLPNLAGGGVLAEAVGWLVALLLLLGVVGVIVRFAPCVNRPVRWVSFGAVLVVIGWAGSSLVYGWYVSSIANYGSAFGSLAAVMITLGYVYLSAIVFLTGLQLDALIRNEIEGRGEEKASPVIVAKTVPAAASAQH